ncbi:MAG: response regulator [Oscillatoriales cyanobacterium SM2_2_1]|nr:response regulator [Oscillatoriales cyanobacterium SM2_2_1]
MSTSASQNLLARLTALSYRRRIGEKLNFGFGLILVVLFLLIGRQYWLSRHSEEVSREVNERILPVALASFRGQRELIQMRSHIRGYLAKGSSESRFRYQESRQAFEQHLAELERLLEHGHDDDGAETEIEQIRTAYDQWSSMPDRLFFLRNQELENQPALELLDREGQPISLSLEQNLNRLIELQKLQLPSRESMELLDTLTSYRSVRSRKLAALKSYLLTRRPAFRFEFSALLEEGDQIFARLRATRSPMPPEQQSLLAATIQLRQKFRTLPPKLLKIAEGDRYQEDLYLFAQSEPNAEKMVDILQNIVRSEEENATRKFAESLIQIRQSQIENLIFGVVALGLAVATAAVLRRQITVPVVRLNEVAGQLRDGDLNVRAEVEYGDEVGELAITFNAMVGQLMDSFSQVKSTLEETKGLNAIFNNLADGLLVVNAQHRVMGINPRFMELFRIDGAMAMGLHIDDLPLPEIHPLLRQVDANSDGVIIHEVELPGGKTGQVTLTNVYRPGDRTTASWLGVAVLVRDITDEREVDKMKTDFISTVSHELRTPLTSVLGFASIIREKLNEDILPITNSLENKKLQRSLKKVESNLEIIVSEAERLTSLINDVLDIAKMEAGKIEWRMEPLNITAVIEHALNATSSLFATSGLYLKQDLRADLPQLVGDRDRLIQVVINLISNAVKFTQKGGITCRTLAEGDQVIVQIIDTGVGIAPEDCPKVFEKFKQVGDTLTDKPKGTGLGLPICVQIIEHHDGKIWVESELGKGSTFSFSLPVVTPNHSLKQQLGTLRFDHLIQQLQQMEHRQQTSTKHGKKILIVDDDPHIRELLRQELESAEYGMVFEAVNGIEAIHKVKELHPDLIIMDVMMPQMNGFDAAAVLRNDPETAHVPIIILSIVQDKERGYRLGIDRYLPKPIHKEQLLQNIDSLLNQGGSNKRVLIIDKDASITRTLAEVLEAKGYSVTEAQSDHEGIEKALTLKPGVIVIDSLSSKESDIVQAVRFERDMEDVVFLVTSNS